jgi:hypothetical protein
MNATEFEKRKAGFLRQSFHRQLGTLAVNAKRIATHSDDAATKEGSLFWVTETFHFTQWTKASASDSLKSDLGKLEQKLSDWQTNWDEIWMTPEKKSSMQQEAILFSEVLFTKLDELLEPTNTQ